MDGTDQPPLRSRAIARSLDGARARAEERVQRFLDAAAELIVEHGGLDFTVQDVVERSGQSLRSFYQFFDGKQHLLLAVYEEAVRDTAAELDAVVNRVDDPLERLHIEVVTIYRWSAHDGAPRSPSPHLTVRAMAAFLFELLATDRAAVVSATEPLFTHMLATLEMSVDAGAVEVDDLAGAAAYLLQTAMFNAFGAATGSDVDDRAEALWNLVFRGLSRP